MPKVEYTFDMDQRVVDPFGNEGIIVMLGSDSGGEFYSVRTEKGCNWYKEMHLGHVPVVPK